MIGSAGGVERDRTAKLVAQWQSGPQTFAGYEQRKLRLALAVSLSMRTICLMPNQS
jgi:hypothetical protein